MHTCASTDVGRTTAVPERARAHPDGCGQFITMSGLSSCVCLLRLLAWVALGPRRGLHGRLEPLDLAFVEVRPDVGEKLFAERLGKGAQLGPSFLAVLRRAEVARQARERGSVERATGDRIEDRGRPQRHKEGLRHVLVGRVTAPGPYARAKPTKQDDDLLLRVISRRAEFGDRVVDPLAPGRRPTESAAFEGVESLA